MTNRLFTDHAISTLDGAITDSDTTISLTDASLFPAPTGTDYAVITIDDTAGNYEHVKYTGVSGNDLTGCTRGYGGTTNQAFADDIAVEIRIDSAFLKDIFEADPSPTPRMPVDMSTSGVYMGFGGSSSATAYNLVGVGGVPQLTGAANYKYTFTNDSLYMQAGTSFNSIEFTNDSDRLVIKTNNLERMQVDDSGVNVSNGTLVVNSNDIWSDGISFDAGTNVLDYYETGTFTPVLSDATTGGNNPTSVATTTGRYIRVAGMVVVYVSFVNINSSGMTGGNGLYVQGLPFTSENATNLRAYAPCNTNEITLGSSPFLAQMIPNVTYIQFFETVQSGSNQLIVSDIINANADLEFSLVYKTV